MLCFPPPWSFTVNIWAHKIHGRSSKESENYFQTFVAIMNVYCTYTHDLNECILHIYTLCMYFGLGVWVDNTKLDTGKYLPQCLYM